ncbi:hypothetical protein [Stenotrophomonas maltophilia]|jgi:hypothetical protein|uniref:hypothetical protein n=1 Tax=Stenotrophomonas maltophilia TaxID=40324 RepID=UPI00066DF81E|nr:hypothetical protein [Stenotrophomonas maltophilia]
MNEATDVKELAPAVALAARYAVDAAAMRLDLPTYAEHMQHVATELNEAITEATRLSGANASIHDVLAPLRSLQLDWHHLGSDRMRERAKELQGALEQVIEAWS